MEQKIISTKEIDQMLKAIMQSMVATTILYVVVNEINNATKSKEVKI